MMRSTTKLAAAAMMLSVLASPALAASLKAPAHPGKPGVPANGQSGAKGPTGAAGPAAKGKAYGYYCQNQSKTHVAGQKGTPFSQCVTAMAKLATGKASSPQAACAGMSKAHTAGEKGTPFSRCIAAGAKLLKDRHR
jgi:hypothetical protein